MTLIGREVVRFVADTVAWVGVELSIAALVVVLARRIRGLPWSPSLGLAFVGAVVAASVAVRFSAPLGWTLVLGGRPAPLIWSAGGAALAVLARHRMRNAPEPADQRD